MRRSKIIATAIFSLMGLLAVAGVVMIGVLLSKSAEKVDCTDIYVSTTSGDTLSLEEQKQATEKLLVIFTRPQCIYCTMVFNTLAEVEVPNLTLDIVSPVSRDDYEKYLKKIDLSKVTEVNYVHDTQMLWHEKFGISGHPVTLYFENGELQWKRIGYFKLQDVLSDR